MRAAIGMFVILGLRISALATVFALGFAVIGPPIALSDEVERSVASATAIGAADMPGTANVEGKVGVLDHVLEISLSDRLAIKAAVETFIWGLSNRQPSAVWLIAPEAEQARIGSKDAVYGFFSRVHPPLAHAKSIVFDAISTDGNLPVINFYVIDTAGLQWRASFAMARNRAGHWKIIECQLTPAPGDLV